MLDAVFSEHSKKKSVLADACKSLGGTGTWIERGGSTTTIQFDHNPGTAWRESDEFPGCYRPLKSRKEGKAAHKALDDARLPDIRDIVARAMLGRTMLFHECRFYRPGYHTLAGTHVITAKIPPADHKEQWKPIDGLRLLKDSEYWAMVEAESVSTTK